MTGPGGDPHVYLGEPDEDLIEHLEPDQLLVATDVAVPRRHLGLGLRIGLWFLRVFVVAMTLALIYAFAVQVVTGR